MLMLMSVMLQIILLRKIFFNVCLSMIVEYMVYNVHCTVYIAPMYTIHCTLMTVHSTLYIVHCTVYSVHIDFMEIIIKQSNITLFAFFLQFPPPSKFKQNTYIISMTYIKRSTINVLYLEVN